MSSNCGLNLKIHSSSLTQFEASVTEGFPFCMSRWASRLTAADHGREMVPIFIETLLPELTGVSLPQESSGLLHSTYLQITLRLLEPGSRGCAPQHQPHTLVTYLLPQARFPHPLSPWQPVIYVPCICLFGTFLSVESHNILSFMSVFLHLACFQGSLIL